MKKQLLYYTAIAVFSLALGKGGDELHAQTIMGIDVSSYEGTVNWASVKAGGYTFAFAKATEGVGLTDSYFVSNETNGTAAGMVMGAYHFAHPENNTATAEANYFLSVAGPYIKACHLPPVLDLEDPPSGPALSTYFTSAQLTTWVQTWMQAVQTATGIAPIIYIGPSNASFVGSSLNTYGLWIDDYNSNPVNPPPNIGVWTNWDFKQYSWTGTIPGISGTNNVDQDVFHGTMNQFNTLIACNAVLADFSSNTQSVCPGSSVTFTDKSTTTGSLTGWKWTFAGGTPDTSTKQNPMVQYNTPGVYSVKEVVTSSVGKDSVIYTTYINVVTTDSLPLVETFQSLTFPPAGWYMNIPNPRDSTWKLCTTTGSGSTQCMFFPANCGQTVNITGQRQQLYTPDYNFASSTNPKMWFDVAYEPSKVPTYSDTLDIYYSLDCGNTWTMAYSKGGMTLCTTGGSTSGGTDTVKGCFVPPNSKAWRTDSVSIAAVTGKPSVMFSFESRSGWGNIIYLDNINITPVPLSVQNITDNYNVKVFPNPSSNGKFAVEIKNYGLGITNVEVYNMLGEKICTAKLDPINTQIDLSHNPSGIYLYRVLTETGGLISEGKMLIEK
jgi:GH25 family lysozyme M1 (1,4-beta-N-acetylmuramidase)